MSIEVSPATPQPLSDDVIRHIKKLPYPGDSVDIITDDLGSEVFGQAINTAGMHLRYNPNQPLTEAPVYLIGDQKNNFMAQVLQSMINASITRPSEDTNPAFVCIDPTGLDACFSAEPYFLRSINHLADMDNNEGPIADIITDDGSPVLLRKLIGNETALTLRDVTINGIPYPAGSITHSYTPKSVEDRAERKRGERPYKEYDISEVNSLGFIRLSRFAIPLGQRSKLDYELGGHTRLERHKRRRMTAKKIALQVEEILHHSNK